MASGSGRFAGTNAKTKARIATEGTVKQKRAKFAPARTPAQKRSPKRK